MAAAFRNVGEIFTKGGVAVGDVIGGVAGAAIPSILKSETGESGESGNNN